jgi:hypothetical protein
MMFFLLSLMLPFMTESLFVNHMTAARSQISN